MNIKVIGLKGMDWIHLAQDRDQWQAVLSSNEPSHSTKGGEFSE
jgi:hypothetical protein